MNLKEIGSITCTNNSFLIKVSKDYHKAIKHMDKFSHIHVFYILPYGDSLTIKQTIAAVIDADVKTGVVTASVLSETDGKYVLIDIKPYFPCEDSVDIQSNTSYTYPIICTPLIDNDIYNYKLEYPLILRNINGETYIQLQESLGNNLNVNDYIKIYWWFDRFDSDMYRQATECDPPYEGSVRCGIFATRSPVRPNPIAMTIAMIIRIDSVHNRIYLSGIESFDKTPCLGFESYNSEEDCIIDCAVPKWLEHWPKWLSCTSNDGSIDINTSSDSELSSILYTDRHESNAPQIEDTDITAIHVRGAYENNLKHVDIDIPYNKITAVVGVSGSGKSSLINNTIYAECRRRMEYLNYNRNILQKPDVISMRGCIPAVIITQDTIRSNSYSTVGTYSNAYDYLRIIYANASIRHCPECGHEIIPLTEDRIDELLAHYPDAKTYDLNMKQMSKEDALVQGKGAFYVVLPDSKRLLLQTKQLCYRCNRIMFEMTPQTFSYLDPDSRCQVCNGTGYVQTIDDTALIEHPELSLLEGASSFYGKLKSFVTNPNANWMKGQVFGLAAKLNVDINTPWNTLPDDFKDILLHGTDNFDVTFSYDNKKNGRKGEITRPVEGLCEIIKRLYDEDSTASLKKYMRQELCSNCNGERLKKEGRMAIIEGVRYPMAAAMTFDEIHNFCDKLNTLPEVLYEAISSPLSSLKEITDAAIQLGIGYISLNRQTSTLSGGERQRLKLLGAFINHMTGILYVFDEPSKGLHPNDYSKVMKMIRRLRDEGNTIIMVEHNEDMMKIADNIVEIGPGAGTHGGTIVDNGSYPYMIEKRSPIVDTYTRVLYNKPLRDDFINIKHLTYGNLKGGEVSFPKNAFTCICGVSGSGKSSLMYGEIFKRALTDNDFDDVIMVDQMPIGKNSKSIVATYIGIMDTIRKAFSMTETAIKNGYDERYFSFNSELGQCSNCKGDGRIKVKYLEDSFITCPQCAGRRYKKDILKVNFNMDDMNIADVLDMSVIEASTYWSDALDALIKVGLGYLKLGQNTASLSGGEASRLKMAKQLMGRPTYNNLYLLDEPTTGLHFSDISSLLKLINELVHAGNTIVAIEHNKHFIKSCDWIIELGPGAGDNGGNVIGQYINN